MVIYKNIKHSSLCMARVQGYYISVMFSAYAKLPGASCCGPSLFDMLPALV